MRVALDVDSTLYRLLEAMQRLPGGERIRYEICDTWAALIHLSGGLEQMKALLAQAMTYDAMRDAGLFPGARAAVDALHEAGAEIHVMTCRPEAVAGDTERFLRDEGIRFHSFSCREPFDKIALCRQLGVRVIVDDQPDTLEQAHAAGIQALTLDHLYTREVVGRLGLRSASSWAELGPMVLSAALAEQAA